MLKVVRIEQTDEIMNNVYINYLILTLAYWATYMDLIITHLDMS